MSFQLYLLIFILHIFLNELSFKNKYNIHSRINRKANELFILYEVKTNIHNSKSN